MTLKICGLLDILLVWIVVSCARLETAGSQSKVFLLWNRRWDWSYSPLTNVALWVQNGSEFSSATYAHSFGRTRQVGSSETLAILGLWLRNLWSCHFDHRFLVWLVPVFHTDFFFRSWATASCCIFTRSSEVKPKQTSPTVKAYLAGVLFGFSALSLDQLSRFWCWTRLLDPDLPVNRYQSSLIVNI